MTSKFRCTAKPLAIDSKFFLVIPGRVDHFHEMVGFLGATAQDFAFNSHLYSIVVVLSTSFASFGR